MGVPDPASRAKPRNSLQLLHENDPCCYFGHGRHDGIKAYDANVTAVVGDVLNAGVFSTAITNWNVHAICQMDRVVIKSALKSAPGFDRLPCDILRADAVPCPYPPPSLDSEDLLV